MSRNRIKIDGEWYIKEESVKDTDLSDEILYALTAEWENNEVRFEASLSILPIAPFLTTLPIAIASRISLFSTPVKVVLLNL
jgi:hypothetical protein